MADWPTWKQLLYLQVADITNFTFTEALFLLHQSTVQESTAYDLNVNVFSVCTLDGGSSEKNRDDL